jgi:hypothetical protein
MAHHVAAASITASVVVVTAVEAHLRWLTTRNIGQREAGDPAQRLISKLGRHSDVG